MEREHKTREEEKSNLNSCALSSGILLNGQFYARASPDLIQKKIK
jgi:hypothetical protein